MKKVAIITASRADYGIYLPVLCAIRRHPALKLCLRAMGDPDYLNFPLPCDFKPGEEDVILVLGDTMPMLFATIDAVKHNIPVAHIHGGDKTGSIDNKIRYAVSAFADFHFPSLPQHADCLINMGIPFTKIKVVGPLGIYAMKDAEFIPEEKLRKQLGLTDKPVIIIIQHPIHGESDQAGQQMRETMEAVVSISGYEPVVIYPNSETGSQDMIRVINEYPFRSFGNLSYLTFVSLLKYSSVIVGNSSCGLVEAPLFGVPCVNIGNRQRGRKSGGQIRNIDYDKDSIRLAMIMPWIGHEPHNPYLSAAIGIDGTSIIANTLAEEM